MRRAEFPLSVSDIQQNKRQQALQKQLSKSCFWDEVEQTLWIDCRKVWPEFGVLSVPSWDALTMSSAKVPAYPNELRILEWSNYSQISYWRKQIPQWVQDSCALFPSHQLVLLHYAGKYPQLLELLDHSPMLAWRLINSGLQESEIVALLSGNRQVMAGQVGWPESGETVKFLRNLRLRLVNDEIAEQVETCLLDEQRLSALQVLPRINSMALSLAARFPELIGSQLHHALAQLPCRPMQCQSMVALLEDAYRLADALEFAAQEVNRIGECRYLVEVSEIYQAWLTQGLSDSPHGVTPKSASELKPEERVQAYQQALSFALTREPQRVERWQDWRLLSQLQQHAWWIDLDTNSSLPNSESLVAWCDKEGVWVALLRAPDMVKSKLKTELKVSEGCLEIVRIRGLDNCLATSNQWTQLHLWQASLKDEV